MYDRLGTCRSHGVTVVSSTDQSRLVCARMTNDIDGDPVHACIIVLCVAVYACHGWKLAARPDDIESDQSRYNTNN